MAFERVVSLFAEKTVSLTRDQNTIEGKFLGTTSGPNTLNPGKVQYKHFFQTEGGVMAVWGATNLDIQLAGIRAGNYVRATYSHQAKPLKAGRKGMNIFIVEVDKALYEPMDENISLQAETSSEPEGLDDGVEAVGVGNGVGRGGAGGIGRNGNQGYGAASQHLEGLEDGDLDIMEPEAVPTPPVMRGKPTTVTDTQKANAQALLSRVRANAVNGPAASKK